MNKLGSLLVFLAFLAVAPQRAEAQGACSPQSPDFLYETCVDSVATFACRSSNSLAEMRLGIPDCAAQSCLICEMKIRKTHCDTV